MQEIQAQIDAIVADVRQAHNDFRARIITPRATDHYPQFYARDWEVAERGNVDAELRHALTQDHYKAMLERVEARWAAWRSSREGRDWQQESRSRGWRR